ncbi:MAG: glycosyltransferase family protein [Lachnospiraceae bacterium]|nr:glycosyltransferase family protein [Lachnospiraceae bacterium]
MTNLSFLNQPEYEQILTASLDHLDQGLFTECYAFLFLAKAMEPALQQKQISTLLQATESKTNAGRLRILIDEILETLIRNDHIELAKKLTSELINAKNEFLYRNILDDKLFYCYILLEISTEEKNAGITSSIQWFQNQDIFTDIYEQVQFAIRRVWFHLPKETFHLLPELIQRFGLSPQFIAIAAIRTVWQEMAADVLSDIEDFLTGSLNPSFIDILHKYQTWQRSHTHNGGEIRQPIALSDSDDSNQFFPPKPCSLSVVYEIDATDPTTFPDPPEKAEEKEIAYIICTNSKRYADEVLLYLQCQILDTGFTSSVYFIKNTRSVFSGYQLVLGFCHAKYKIYMHQDLFMADRYFTKHLIQTLQNTPYHMLGVTGTDRMPSTGRWWDSERQYGCMYLDKILFTQQIRNYNESRTCVPAEGLDGILLATDMDLPWREDLFSGFHFYDVSQVCEFRRQGFPVGIYLPQQTGVLHLEKAAANVDETPYEKDRIIFLEEYIDLLPAD